MKAGVVYPQIELGGDTGAVKAFAQAAEDLGYDHIVIYDHVLGAVHAGREPKLTGPYKESDPFHEPLVTYAYLAGVTKKLELVTGVIILPQRQTALFAKQAADVDLSQTAGFAWASANSRFICSPTTSSAPPPTSRSSTKSAGR
jgi:alkanesulfonate monooxygenase SsuD/methylene tetrahydromethanopterin reductase-like flavin-dependent oxidoreductase (luciferase family)